MIAVGLCQFLPDTAQKYGLVDRANNIDHRTDPEKSIQAAAKFIHEYTEPLGTQDLAVGSFQKILFFQRN